MSAAAPSTPWCCGCFAGLFGHQPPVAGFTFPRRFEPEPFPADVDAVINSLRPRAVTTEHHPGQIDQTWASPLPGEGRDAQHSPAEDLTRGTIQNFQAEQLVAGPGNLPPPLTQADREQVIRCLLPTATFQMRSKLPRSLVEATGLEGQTLRRRLVNGATVVFFSAGYPGKRFVFERAKKLGVRSVVIDQDEKDSWVRTMEREGVIAKFISIDMSRPSDVIFREALKHIKALGQDGLTGEADAVLTMVELSLPIVARLCEHLGLPGHTPRAVDTARDKHAARAALHAAGLPTPKNFLIRRESQVLEAGNHVGYPAVMKPVSGAASLGVKKVTSAEELMACYRDVVKEMSSLVVVGGALQQGDGTGQGVAAAQVVQMSVLLEQFLDGQEVDVDLVLSEGEWRYCCITDNGPTIEPYFNETWGVCPSMLPKKEQRELKNLAVSCTKALGFTSGAFHVECKYTSTGPHLVEVNARMGGGPVHEWNLRTWGVDLVEESIFCALGIPARPCASEKPIESTAFHLCPAPHSGVVQELPDLKALQRLDKSVVWSKPLVKVGDRVVGPEEGMPTWMLDIVISGRTSEEARDHIFKIVAENLVKILPVATASR